MRQRDAEVFERIPARGISRGWTIRQRKPMPLPQDRSQHCIHEPRCTRNLGRSREIHRIVDHRGRGHAIEMEDLKEAEPRDHDDCGIELRERPFRDVSDEVIERALPSQCAGDDRRGERAVAFIVEPIAGMGECGREIGALARNSRQCFECGDPRWRDRHCSPSGQTQPRGQRMTGKKVAHTHRTSPFGLHFDERQPALAGRDVDLVT